MSDYNADFIFENLVPNSTTHKKSSLKTNYSVITDIAQGQNYSSGLVNYTNVSLQSTNDGSFFDLSNSFAQVQMTYTLNINNGTFLDASGNAFTSNINAVTKKSDSHFIHNSWIKMAGVEVQTNNGAGFQNLYTNEKKKQRNPNLSYLDNEMEQFYLDSADSYVQDPVSLESNNNGNTSSALYNKAIYQRNKYYFDIQSSPILNFVNPSSMSQYYYPYFQNANATTKDTLVWYDVLTIPLKDIHELFEKAPPLIRLSGMEIKIQYNAGSAVSYTCTLNAGNNAVASENISIGNGGTFPLMIASFENLATSALRFTPTAGQTCSFTLTVQIGWNSNVSPTRILIPYYKLSNNSLNKITNQQVFVFSANHCELDTTLTGISGNANVQRVLNTHYRSVRKVWLLPFFSNLNKIAGTNIIVPYQNPRSSAPNTMSVLRLRNVNISIDGHTYYQQETLSTPAQFYNENFYHFNSKDWSCGNQDSNPLKSGMILKSDWLKCYNAYEFDLNTSIDDETDLTLKSIGLNFQMDGNSTLLYDFFILIECEKNYSMNVIECILQDLSLVSGK